MKTFLIGLVVLASTFAGERKAVVPAAAPKPIGPYSPGILTSRFLYVSGQGMTNPNGTVPEAWEAQVRQCLENVKGIVEAAGLGMANVVATQVYVDDLRKWPEAAKIYAGYFPADPPAMTLLEVAGMPGGTRVEINAVAIRNLSSRRALQVAGVAASGPYSIAVMAGKRLYVSAMTGRDAGEVERKIGQVLRTAAMTGADVVFANRYSAGSHRVGDIAVQALPGSATMATAVIAVKGGGLRRSDCAAADGALFCAAATSSASLTPPQWMELDSFRERLRVNGFAPEQVAVSNVYLEDLGRFQAMNAIYAAVFATQPPARTTVQPVKAGGTSPFRMSVVAEN